jgi:predicted alpha/beta hydrolase family esterase
MRIILIHGFNANPTMNFHPWLRDELHAAGFQVIAPELPLSSKEELDMPAILEVMKKEVGYLKNDDILLGHSLGGLLVLQYLEAVEMVETPRAVVLVAAPWNVARPELRRLFVDDLDADVLMWKAREFVIIHSQDDKLVPIEHGRKLAQQLRARLIETATDDHYMGEQYPILLETIKQIATTPFEYAPGETLEDQFK